MRFLEDLEPGADFACGGFTLSRAEIADFAARYDPQPFHLDEAAARESYFRGLCASGLHTQGAAIGLMVRAIADVAVVAGHSLHAARFLAPVRPDAPYAVSARWTAASPSPSNPARGRADIRLTVRDAMGDVVAELGVTYVVRRRPG